MARGRLGDVQSTGDLGQEAHRDELIGADAERTQRQGQDAQPCSCRAQRGEAAGAAGREVSVTGAIAFLCGGGCCRSAALDPCPDTSATYTAQPTDFCFISVKVTGVSIAMQHR